MLTSLSGWPRQMVLAEARRVTFIVGCIQFFERATGVQFLSYAVRYRSIERPRTL